jgi:hypothetical protein
MVWPGEQILIFVAMVVSSFAVMENGFFYKKKKEEDSVNCQA